MYNYIILNKIFEVNTNEIEIYVPNEMLNNTGYKIDNSRFVFTTEFISNPILNQSNKILTKEAMVPYLGRTQIRDADINPNVKFDLFQYKYVAGNNMMFPIMVYVTSDDANNGLMLDTNTSMNLIASGYVNKTEGNSYYIDVNSDWVMGKVEKIKLKFYDEQFDKLCLRKMFLNIKLAKQYGNDTSQR